MFGIPTLVTDYSNDRSIFNPDDKDQFEVDSNLDRDKNLYNLQKAIVAAYRRAGIPTRTAKEVAVRNGSQILDALLNPPIVEEISPEVIDAVEVTE